MRLLTMPCLREKLGPKCTSNPLFIRWNNIFWNRLRTCKGSLNIEFISQIEKSVMEHGIL